MSASVGLLPVSDTCVLPDGVGLLCVEIGATLSVRCTRFFWSLAASSYASTPPVQPKCSVVNSLGATFEFVPTDVNPSVAVVSTGLSYLVKELPRHIQIVIVSREGRFGQERSSDIKVWKWHG